MKLKLIKPVVIARHPGLRVGDVFEDKDGSLLEYCVEVKDEPRALNVPTSREPEIESRDPEIRPVKRTKKTSL